MSFCLGSIIQKANFTMSAPQASTTKQRQAVGNLRSKKLSSFSGRQPEQKSHWGGEAAGPWRPVTPTKVVEVRYDHFSDGRFRHRLHIFAGTTRQTTKRLLHPSKSSKRPTFRRWHR